MFQTELNYIKNERIKNAGIYLVAKIPEYFYTIPASSTQKYHPKYTTGSDGLYKHTKAAVKIAHELLVLDMYKKIFTEDEQDILILSLILHDGLKKGVTNEKYTRFDHPILMSKYVMSFKSELSLTDEEITMLCDNIKCHMGQWNCDYQGNEVLEVPRSRYQKFVHLCDYLASRKFLNVEFDENNEIID